MSDQPLHVVILTSGDGATVDVPYKSVEEVASEIVRTTGSPGR